MDLLDNAVLLVTGVIREQLAEQVIASLNSNCVVSGCFYELHLGGAKFNFPRHLVLRDFLLGALENFLNSSRSFLRSTVAESSGARSSFSPKT